MRLRGLHLHFDCESGAAGDMTLGALIDAGVPEEVVRDAVAAVGIDGARLRVEKVVKGGIAATDVKVWVEDLEPPREADTGGAPGVHSRGLENHSPEPEKHSPEPEEHSHGPERYSHGEHSHGSEKHSHGSEKHSHGSEKHSHGPEAHSHGSEKHSHGPVKHSHGSEKHSHGPEAHSHATHAHHHYGAIRARIAAAPLAPGVARRAIDIFDRLAEAEAHLHGVSPAEVVLHEAGAADAIADIVGAAAALDYLAPSAVSCSRVAMGEGWVSCAHGRLPVPSPAALEILRRVGAPLLAGGVRRELCTPTGAAILASSVTDWEGMPTLRPAAVGYGCGDAELADRPNVMRAVLGESQGEDESLLRLETNIDDMSAELCSHVADRLFAAGAADVWWAPVTMKKSRPGWILGALVPRAVLSAASQVIFRETTSIGIRFDLVSRMTLARREIEVATPHGDAAMKIALLAGEVVNAAPEFESCRRLAEGGGVALKEVYAAALAAWEAMSPAERTSRLDTGEGDNGRESS